MTDGGPRHATARAAPPRRNIALAFICCGLFAGACGAGFGWWADRIYENGRADGAEGLLLAIGLGLAAALFVVGSLVRQALQWAKGIEGERQASKLEKRVVSLVGGGSLLSVAAFANGSHPWQLGMVAFVGASSVLLVIALPFVALAVPSAKPNTQ